MFVFLPGAKIDREEWPHSAEDLAGQTWRRGEDGWELVGEVHRKNQDKPKGGK